MWDITWKNKYVTTEEELKIYKALVWLVTIHGSVLYRYHKNKTDYSDCWNEYFYIYIGENSDGQNGPGVAAMQIYRLYEVYKIHKQSMEWLYKLSRRSKII